MRTAEIPRTAQPSRAAGPTSRFPLSIGLRVLGGLAVALIAYSYLYGLPTGHSGLLRTVRLWGNIPLGIGDDFGVFGICVLLVVAGYLVSPWIFSSGKDSSRPLTALCVQIACCYLLVLVPAVLLPAPARYCGILLTLLVLPVFGHAVRLAEHGALRGWQAGCAGALCLLLTILSDHRYPIFADRWYPLTMLYAALAVVLATRIRRVPGQPSLRSTARTNPGYYHGLDLLRVVASSLVVYTHMTNWFSVYQVDWAPLSWLNRQLTGNLRMDDHASMFGVTMFFLISGVVVTHVAGREGPGRFLWRRASRVLPLMIVITFVVWALMQAGIDVGESSTGDVTFLDFLANIDFSAFFSDRKVFVLSVTWTLLIQLAFYAYVSLTIPLLRRTAWLSPAIGTTLSFTVVCFTAYQGTDAMHEIARIAAYLPMLFLGQLISLVRAKRVHPAAAAAIGVADYFVVLWAEYLGWSIVRPTNALLRTLVIVFVVVLLTASIRNRLTTSAVVSAWSKRTYAIYLLHPSVMYPLLALLVPRISPLPAILIALAAVGVASDLAYRFVESPINRALRGRGRSTRRRDPLVRTENTL